MGTNTRPRINRGAICGVVLLFLPALLSFFTHVLEHAWPMGFTRAVPGQLSPFVARVGWILLWCAEYCVLPTWVGIALAFVASACLSLGVAARGGLAALSALAYVAMTGIQAVLNSCFGEAPHAFWIPI